MLEDYEWELIPMKGFVNNIVAGKVDRPEDFLKYYNDQTRTTCKELPELSTTDYTWTIQDYIWEFIPTKKQNEYLVKLIADDKPDLYLSYNKKQDKVLTTKSKDKWAIEGKSLKHQASGKYLNIKNGEVKLLPKKSKLVMCPQK